MWGQLLESAHGGDSKELVNKNGSLWPLSCSKMGEFRLSMDDRMIVWRSIFLPHQTLVAVDYQVHDMVVEPPFYDSF